MFFTSSRFANTRTIFMIVINVNLLCTRNNVQIPFPTTTRVRCVVSSSCLVLTQRGRSRNVVFSMTSVKRTYFTRSEYRRYTQDPRAISTRYIVISILFHPLTVICRSQDSNIRPRIHRTMDSCCRNTLLFMRHICSNLRNVNITMRIVTIGLCNRTSTPKIISYRIPTSPCT